MPLNAASDQGLHCLLSELSIKIRIKTKSITFKPETYWFKGKKWEIPFGLNRLKMAHSGFSKGPRPTLALARGQLIKQPE